jgi:hypothetical protein
VNWLKDGMVVVIVARDEFTEHLTSEAVDLLESLGSKSIRNVKYRDSYVLMTEKGNPSDRNRKGNSPLFVDVNRRPRFDNGGA